MASIAIVDDDSAVVALLYQFLTHGDDAIRYVEELRKAGVDEIMCMIQMGTISQDVMMETIRQFGEHVIPHFRAM